MVDEGRHEILVRATTRAQAEAQLKAGATKACQGAYREEARKETITVCADTPLDQCPRDSWDVTVRCGEV